ncbi:MAG: methyltransferase domain-containing protein [Deltaproteobacteria bacterium]|nr:methyltransferase domain-containing protein [Deltaproteobacteria bacterium]MCW5805101.1 methyltransferase domain-containing protein [Deltaproteobacteria bacterium]
MTVQSKRTLKVEKLARIYDDEIAPVWGSRFGKMLLRNLAVPDKGQVLDISCGTGYPTIEILRRMRDGSRLIAIDASSAMLDVARRKVADLGPLGKKGVFFRTESAVPKLSFADDVYDLVVCNLGLDEVPSLEVALRDFARVCKLGGEVRCTLPLAGTFQEFHDLYREVLIKHDKHEALDRLERHIAHYPSLDHVERCMKTAQLSGGIEIEEFTLLFKSSREFFFAPVIEYGPLAEWKDIAGGGQEMQDVFWYIKEAIDAYFDGRPFQVTVKAGCIIGTKHEPRAISSAPLRLDGELGSSGFAIDVDLGDGDEQDITGGAAYAEHSESGLPLPPHKIAAGSVRVSEADELDVIEEEVIDDADYVLDPESPAEQALDAFIEGKKRPPHLDD